MFSIKCQLLLLFLYYFFSCAKSDCPLTCSDSSEPSTCFLTTFAVLRSPWAFLGMALVSILRECEHDLASV